MTTIENTHPLEYYTDRRYKVLLWQDTDGIWNVEIPALPGCRSEGETVDEALEMIEDAKSGWIEMVLEDGGVIPESDILLAQ